MLIVTRLTQTYRRRVRVRSLNVVITVLRATYQRTVVVVNTVQWLSLSPYYVSVSTVLSNRYHRTVRATYRHTMIVVITVLCKQLSPYYVTVITVLRATYHRTVWPLSPYYVCRYHRTMLMVITVLRVSYHRTKY